MTCEPSSIGSGPARTGPSTSSRYENLWNLDLRPAHYLRLGRVSGQLAADLFNVFNANTELQRERHILSPNFNRLNQNLSPRILRVGLRLGF